MLYDLNDLPLIKWFTFDYSVQLL